MLKRPCYNHHGNIGIFAYRRVQKERVLRRLFVHSATLRLHLPN